MYKIFVTMVLGIVLFNSFVYAEENKVVARIGDRQFTSADFERWLGLNNESSRESIASDNKLKVNMLNQIISGMVIADLARKDGFDKQPVTKEKMEIMVNNFLTLEYLDKVVAARVTVSEDEIRKYYDENSERFHQREAIRARHILIKTSEQMDEAARGAARKKAEGLLTQARAGSDFAALAQEYSEDPGSRERGGSLGLFSRGRMVPEFDAAAFSMKPGEISEVVESKFGFHIIKVEHRQEGTVKPLEEVKEMIVTTLSRNKRREEIDRFVQQAMKKANAEVDVRALLGPDPHL